ncbi:MAG: hypothetical protein NT029_05355 [Armatimonadetes bacterium]|nr:hypothetical protein [Armatimonadota bacterium]
MRSGIHPLPESLHAAVCIVPDQPGGRLEGPHPPSRCSQVVHHLRIAPGLDEKLKGPTHDVGLLGVHDRALRRLLVSARELTRVGDVYFAVPDRRHVPAAVAPCDHLLHLRARPLAHHLRVHAVHEDRHLLAHVAGEVRREVLTHELDLDASLVQQVLGDMVGLASCEATHVGHAKPVEQVGLCVAKQRLPVRALQIRSAPALVGVDPRQGSASFGDMARVDVTLRVDRGEVAMRLVIRAAS